MPRAAATLGLEVLDADVDEGTIELAFTGTEDFTNPAGNVLGAFQAAWGFFDTVGPALLATLEPNQFQSTLELHVQFLRPVRPGRVTARGRVVHAVSDMAYLASPARWRHADRAGRGDRRAHPPQLARTTA